MRQYELPIYHFAKIPFHYVIYASKLADKEPHLKQVLEFTALTPNHWVAQDSRETLMKYYISINRLSEAQALVTNLKSDNAENSYLKTILAKAQLQTDLFITHAQRTFARVPYAEMYYMSSDLRSAAR